MQTLEGVDSDEDGVRDDVQRFIAQTFDDPPTREALREFALAAQNGMVEAASSVDAEEARESMLRAASCITAARGESSEALTGIEEILVNTETRSRAYIALNGQANGTIRPVVLSAAEQCAGASPGGVRRGGGGTVAVVVHVNGMFTSEVTAYENARALEQQVRASGQMPPGYNETIFFNVYNQNEIAVQFFELAIQAGGDSWGRIAAIINGSRAAPAWFTSFLASVARDYSESSYVLDQDLRTHIDFYRSQLDRGRKVIVVPHSQGNFYANEACRRIGSQSLGVVATATPATQVCGRGAPYTTTYNDRVIRETQINPLVLRANTEGSAGNSWIGHNFQNDYIGSPIAGTRIMGHIGDAFDTLPIPATVIGNGPVTVTLRWGDQPDLDLHVFEPDGVHVYYANRQGSFGELDRDDTDGFGPENYVVPLSTLSEGTYWVGVNYFSGSAPETASVQISTAGTTYPSMVRYLPSARGSGGNATPVPVAEISVTRRDGRFVYQVREVQTGPRLRDPADRPQLCPRSRSTRTQL